MRSLQCLEINKLSETGEIKRRIRCLSGHVTVFRSQNPADIDLYTDALCGKSTAARFSILLDGYEFNPKTNTLIGFGEELLDESVESFLMRNGASRLGLENLLLSFGLGGVSSKSCLELNLWEKRIVQLLGATFKSDQAVILNDPFEPIPETWRERTAELLSAFAWEKKGIVVVVKLSYRPKCWIDNEVIARIQLERPRQLTIGYGGESTSNQVISNIREEFKKGREKTSSLTALSGIYTGAQKIGFLNRGTSWQRFGIGIFGVALLAIIATTWIENSPKDLLPKEEDVKTANVPVTQYGEKQNESESKIPPGLVAVNQVKQDVTTGSINTNFLDSYPSEVKESILRAYDATTVDTTKYPKPNIYEFYNKFSPEPIKGVDSATGQINSQEQSFSQQQNIEIPPPSNFIDPEVFKQREHLRQKFLEALAKPVD